MPIILKDINKSFGSHNILTNFNLIIGDGDMLSITGGSGKGKSTLLNIIGLLEPYQSGGLIFNDIRNPSINSKQAMLLRRNVLGYLFQNFALMENCTVEENLNWALAYQHVRNKKKCIGEALERVNLPAEMMKQKVVELSGGEQQRVAIARLFLKPCQVVLADEPTGSLDPSNRDLVVSLLHQLHDDGKTVVIVTHDMMVANSCPKRLEL